MTTFVVDDVKSCKTPLEKTNIQELVSEYSNISTWKIWTHFKLPNTICGEYDIVKRYHQDYNSFMETIHLAYDHHYPLTLCPDHIWMVIANGLASHISHGDNAEKLRREFVQFDGKEKISIYRPSFKYKGKDNDWVSVIEEFSEKIEKHIGKKYHDLIVSDFSTTGMIEKTVSQIILMDCVKHYFRYHVFTKCGIPLISLEGKVQDWINIKQRVQQFSNFGLDWWVQHLNPLLDEFIEASKGNINQNFWKQIYKQKNSSGGPYINGWITDFFPYLWDGSQNSKLGVWKKQVGAFGPFKPNNFCQTMSRAPFTFDHDTGSSKLQFLGGFMGTIQNIDTLALKPQIGWVICEAENGSP